MKPLRLVGLVAVLLGVLFAQYLFDHRTLSDFFPNWLLGIAPWLARYRFWIASDLLTLALAIASLSALGFGLLVAPWPQDETVPVLRQPAAQGRALPLARALIGAGLLLGLFLAAAGGDSLWPQLLWLLSLVLLLLGAALLDRRPAACPPARLVRPERTWPWLLALLAGGAMLWSWRLVDVPQRIDRATVLAGTSGLALLEGSAPAFFSPGPTGLPWLAYAPTAVALWLSGDPLLGTRLSGLAFGLLGAAATWLLGCELLRRRPRRGAQDFLLEDDGGLPALAAAAVAALSLPAVHFSRLPLLFEATAWGTLAAWALLRGLRRGSSLALALSGLLAGLAAASSPTGWTFVLALPLWVLGALLFWPAQASAVRRGERSRLLLWPAALFVVLAPLVGVWLARPGTFAAALRALDVLGGTVLPSTPPWTRFQQMPAAFLWLGDRSPFLGYPGALFGSLLTPFLVLGVGALLFHLDRRIGWSLLTLLGVGVMAGALLAREAPSWPHLLPLVPAAALVIVFALDRSRLFVIEEGGPWLAQAAMIALVGLIVWAGLANQIAYHRFVGAETDAASAAARLVRSLPDSSVPILVGGTAGSSADADVFALLGAELPAEIGPEGWPAALPPGSRLLIAAGERPLLDEVGSRYPGGRVEIMRNLRGNPVLYVYIAP